MDVQLCADRIPLFCSLLRFFHTVPHSLASTFVLSKLPVLNHSGLNSLRRMFATLATCFFFGVPMSVLGGAGILMSFSGFYAFTYYRSLRTARGKEIEVKDGDV
jgi:drug/metabolite transporter (DMT)-like permease